MRDQNGCYVFISRVVCRLDFAHELFFSSNVCIRIWYHLIFCSGFRGLSLFLANSLVLLFTSTHLVSCFDVDVLLVSFVTSPQLSPQMREDLCTEFSVQRLVFFRCFRNFASISSSSSPIMKKMSSFFMYYFFNVHWCVRVTASNFQDLVRSTCSVWDTTPWLISTKYDLWLAQLVAERLKLFFTHAAKWLKKNI